MILLFCQYTFCLRVSLSIHSFCHTCFVIIYSLLSKGCEKKERRRATKKPYSRGQSVAYIGGHSEKSEQESLMFVMQPEKLLISRETWCYHCLLQKKKWCMFFYDFVLVTAASFSFVEQIVSHLESLQPSILPV